MEGEGFRLGGRAADMNLFAQWEFHTGHAQRRDAGMLYRSRVALFEELNRLVDSLVGWMEGNPGFSRQDLRDLREYRVLFGKVRSRCDVTRSLFDEGQKAITAHNQRYYELLLALQEDFELNVIPGTWEEAVSLPPAYGISL